MALLCLPGCERVKRMLGRGKTQTAAAVVDGGPGEHAEHAEGDGGHGEHAVAEQGHGEHAAEADGGTEESDVEAEYTPRNLSIDEEDCDDVTREALAHLREQGRVLAERQKALVEREGAVKAKEQAQVQIAAQVEDRIKELTRLSAELDDRVANGGRPSGSDPARLAAAKARRAERAKEVSRLIGTMTAQRAASLLGEFQDDELAVEVLQGLPQEVAGKVLGQMRPASAARLAERIGGGDKEGARP